MIAPLITRAVPSPVKVRSRETDASGLNLKVVIAFCLVGIFLTLYGVLRFPEFGAVIAQYNQF